MKPQHMEALERANEIRLARAQLKRDLKAGKVRCSELLLDPVIPEWLERMPVEELLDAIPKLWLKKRQAMLHTASIKLSANVGDLTFRKRSLLGKQIRAWEAKQDRNKGKAPKAAAPRRSMAQAMRAEKIA